MEESFLVLFFEKELLASLLQRFVEVIACDDEIFPKVEFVGAGAGFAPGEDLGAVALAAAVARTAISAPSANIWRR